MTLSELRKKKNFRMVDIAGRLGISQGRYSHIERGTRKPSEELIKKISDILGEPVESISMATRLNGQKNYKMNSWMSHIRINGLPLTRSFAYYLEAKESVANALTDDGVLKSELKDFIDQNITYAVIAEMTENRNLIPSLRMQLAKRETPMTQNITHEQYTGTK